METLTPLENESKQNIRPEDTSHAAIIHLSSFASFIGIPFGSVLGPLITWLIWRDQSSFVDYHSKEALNFNLSILLYEIAAVILGLILFLSPILTMAATDGENPVGVLLSIPGLWLFITGIGLIQIFRIVAIIIAAVKAGNGEYFKYPLSIRFIK